jgi:hypothetical protein
MKRQIRVDQHGAWLYELVAAPPRAIAKEIWSRRQRYASVADALACNPGLSVVVAHSDGELHKAFG